MRSLRGSGNVLSASISMSSMKAGTPENRIAVYIRLSAGRKRVDRNGW